MSMKLKTSLKLSQNLKMNTQLQQSISLLSQTLPELEQSIQEELLQNPVLEEIEDVQELETSESKDELSKDEDLDPSIDFEFTDVGYISAKSASSDFPFETLVSSESQTLREHLEWQIQVSQFSEMERELILSLIDFLNEDAYLSKSLDEISLELKVSVSELGLALKNLQTLDPAGVGSRNLKECLYLQACSCEEDTKDLLYIIDCGLHYLQNKNYEALAKEMNKDIEEILFLAKIIQNLNPYPGKNFSTQNTSYIVPDVYVEEIENRFRVKLNEERLPRIRITKKYQDIMKQSKTFESQFIKQKTKAANWFIRALNQRQRTIYSVMQAILKKQEEFFRKGADHLCPMILKDIATETGFHESTISRVTTHKYVHTQHGLFELKYFFNLGVEREEGAPISIELVKKQIKEIVSKEDPKNPVTDAALFKELQNRLKIQSSRRSIAKYREMAGILPPSHRKKFF